MKLMLHFKNASKIVKGSIVIECEHHHMYNINKCQNIEHDYGHQKT
jgi:hypothetical protein